MMLDEIIYKVGPTDVSDLLDYLRKKGFEYSHNSENRFSIMQEDGNMELGAIKEGSLYIRDAELLEAIKTYQDSREEASPEGLEIEVSELGE